MIRIIGYNFFTGEIIEIECSSKRKAKKKIINTLLYEKQNLKLAFDKNEIYAFAYKNNFVKQEWYPKKIRKYMKEI